MASAAQHDTATLDDILASPPPPAHNSFSPAGGDSDSENFEHPDPFSDGASEQESRDTLGLSLTPQSMPRQANHRKRPSEDLTQYAESVARRVRLKAANTDDLKEFAMLPGTQQSVLLAAMVMRNTELIQLVQPTEVPYQISTSLDAKMEKYAFVIMLEPALSAYIKDGGPIKKLTDFLQRYPSWGLTHEVMEDPSKFKVIVAKARDYFVTLRNLIKTKIEESIGTERNADGTLDSTDIATLCHQIVALRAKIAPKVRPSVKLCARIAFLRRTFMELKTPAGKVDRSFWPKVDEKLDFIRTSKGQDALRISDVFSRILTADRALHGRGDVEGMITQAVSMENTLDTNEQSNVAN